MTKNNPLDPVLRSYQISCDCTKISLRALTRGETRLLKGTAFAETREQEARSDLLQAQKEAADFAILSMWVIFERELHHHLQLAYAVLAQPAQGLRYQIHQHLVMTSERWQNQEILDLFKAAGVSAELIGQAKNIKRFRDWVAHKNPKKPPVSQTTPETTYQVLSALLQEIQQLTPS